MTSIREAIQAFAEREGLDADALCGYSMATFGARARLCASLHEAGWSWADIGEAIDRYPTTCEALAREGGGRKLIKRLTPEILLLVQVEGQKWCGQLNLETIKTFMTLAQGEGASAESAAAATLDDFVRRFGAIVREANNEYFRLVSGFSRAGGAAEVKGKYLAELSGHLNDRAFWRPW